MFGLRSGYIDAGHLELLQIALQTDVPARRAAAQLFLFFQEGASNFIEVTKRQLFFFDIKTVVKAQYCVIFIYRIYTVQNKEFRTKVPQFQIQV
jgi:hypothetical protein